ncbi:magnesium transporter [Lewinella marina]|uniref:Magnesium transport protein CorA n=1 Tax=Neolewinella marina TaxID=438751 RepID=A0A2G0CH14_9BACT|nr:magnesium/cobalt transporter CorA [Neolewinella marina]NJB86257.1 magnesium transporter [Neolewinella marina]PHK99269.1 magnesium and cobalt transport protein CorA [Neolewinella marina]
MRIYNLLRSTEEKAVTARRKAGAPPGTMIYTGHREMERVHVHLTQYHGDFLEVQTEEESIPAPRTQQATQWYDLRGLHKLELVERLGREHGMHPLALEDIVDVHQRPKMEVYENGVLFIIKAFAFDAATRDLSMEQISIYLTENTVLSFQEDAGDLFRSVRKRLETSSGRIRSRGPDYLAYALVDNIVDKYFTVIDQIESELDRLEDVIMKSPEMSTKSQIHDLRLALLTLRKSISPLRELMNRFSDSESRLISQDTQVYVADLRDHVIQITDLVETYRDVTNGLYDLYVSEISFRMNSVMQTLTIVSTIFIPLSFLVGVYGMNWEYMPELRTRYGYFVLWGAMILIIVGMLAWFRSRRWI